MNRYLKPLAIWLIAGFGFLIWLQSATALSPIPTGAVYLVDPATGLAYAAAGGGTADSTAANQVTGNASLASIDTKASTINTSIGTTNTSIGATNETAAASNGATSGLNGLFRRLLGFFDTVANGATSTTRIPVTQADVSAITGTCSSACNGTILVSALMTGYQSVQIQITSAGTGATLQYETSEDSTNGTDGTWVTTTGFITNATGINSPTATTNVAAGYAFPKRLKWWHAKFTAYTSGTVTLVGHLSATAVPGPVSAYSAIANGQVAHGVTQAGNPVRIGARARAVGTPYTAVSADQAADLVTDLLGNLKITQEYSFANLAATNGAGAAVKASAGVLHSVSVNTTAATGTLSLYDAASATNPIAVLDCAATARSQIFDAVFATGLYWVLAGGNCNVTVTYR